MGEREEEQTWLRLRMFGFVPLERGSDDGARGSDEGGAFGIAVGGDWVVVSDREHICAHGYYYVTELPFWALSVPVGAASDIIKCSCLLLTTAFH